MRDLCPVVFVPAGSMYHRRKHRSVSRWIASKLVGHELPGWLPLMLQGLTEIVEFEEADIAQVGLRTESLCAFTEDECRQILPPRLEPAERRIGQMKERPLPEATAPKTGARSSSTQTT